MTTISQGLGVYIWGVVPILPALPALLIILPMVAFSILIAVVSLLKPSTLKRLARLAWRQRWSITVMLVVATAIWWTVHRIGVSSGGTNSRQQTGGGDWPMYRGSLRRLGAVASTDAPRRPDTVWTYHRSDEAFYASPAIVGDRVYVVGSRGDQGRIYCLDALTGDVIWSAAPPGYRATFSSPVVSGNWLVCGEGLHHARMARVVCLDLRPGHEGSIAWTFQTQSHVECTPVIADGRVYFGAGDDGVYCLELEGSRAGQPVWHVSGAQFPDAETSLAVHDGRVYVGLGLNGNALCALNAVDGQLIQRIALPYPVFSPPAIHKGKLYVGMGVGDYVTPQQEPIGRVHCIDLNTLESDWFHETSGTVLGAVAVHEQGLLVACADGTVVRLNEEGQPLATRATYAPIISSPAVAEDMVYVVNGAGKLYGLDIDTLDVMWQQQLGTDGRFISSPAVAHGRIYVGTEKDGFLCVGRPAPATEAAVWPGRLGGAGFSGCRDQSPLPTKPTVAWQFPSTGDESHIVTAPVAPAGDHLVVPVAAGDLAGVVLLKELTTDKPSVEWHVPIAAGVHSSPAVAGGHVFFLDGTPNAATRTLYGVSLENPKKRWSIPVSGEASDILLADEHSILIQPDHDSLMSLTHAGATLWQQKIGPVQQLVSGNAAMLALISDDPRQLTLVDRPTGKVLWSSPLFSEPTTSPVLLKDAILFGTESGLELRSIEDGRIRQSSLTGVAAPLYADGLRCVFTTSDNEVVFATSKNLQPLMVVDLDERAVDEMLLTIDGALARQGSTLFRVESNGTVRQWLDLSELGSVTSPMVLDHGRLFLATSQRGLVCIAEDSR